MNSNVIELNVGGSLFTTTKDILCKHPESQLCQWFESPESLCKDGKSRYFIDRDGQLFRFVLEYLRNDRVTMPDTIGERQRLLQEAQFYQLEKLEALLAPSAYHGASSSSSTTSTHLTKYAERGSHCQFGYITVGYQGTFSFGPQGLPAADVNFRKINRILVSGRVGLCREVFGDTLNEGRDPDRGNHNDRERYTARYYLKHNVLEYAFDMLAEAGFKLTSSCASGTSGNTADPKPGSNTEEDRWAHYNEFVFYRQPQ